MTYRIFAVRSYIGTVMGIYINKGNEGFRRIRNSEYVDKSGLIAIVNKTLFTRQCFSCVTRSRRFGKTMAAEMLCAYYDKSCDSRSLFSDLEIAKAPSFEEHLNKYPVISIDVGFFVSKHRNKTVVDEMDAEIVQEICSYYPAVPVHEKDDLMQYLIRVSLTTGDKFVFIIDEWDAILRECGQMMFDESRKIANRHIHRPEIGSLAIQHQWRFLGPTQNRLLRLDHAKTLPILGTIMNLKINVHDIVFF